MNLLTCIDGKGGRA